MTCLLGRRVIFMAAKVFILKLVNCELRKKYGWFTHDHRGIGTVIHHTLSIFTL